MVCTIIWICANAITFMVQDSFKTELHSNEQIESIKEPIITVGDIYMYASAVNLQTCTKI